MKTRLLYDTNGNPFHLPGTRIYVEPDGELTYECPQCPPNRVPTHMVSGLARHARKRPVAKAPKRGDS